MQIHAVSAQEWEAARQQLLVKEKEITRARDALAAERRRMPWLAVEKKYEFEGPKGKASLRDLFEGRHQLIVYRAFYEPGVFGWPDHACRGCSMVADQVAHLAHLNARDTTLVFASRAPQADIARLKARMGWEMIPWYTVTDSFDADFGVGEWHGTNVFFRDGDRIFRTYFINNRGDEQMGGTWNYLDITPLGRQEEWEDSPAGYPQTPTYKWWNWHDSYVEGAAPDKRWVEVSDAGEAAFRNKRPARSREPARSCAGVCPARDRRLGMQLHFTGRYDMSEACTGGAIRPRQHCRDRRGRLALSRGSADVCDHGAADGCAVLDRRCVRGGITGGRNGPDVPADERLSFAALAEADLRSARPRPSVLTRPRRTFDNIPPR